MAAPIGGLAVNFPHLNDCRKRNTSTALSVDASMPARWDRSATFRPDKYERHQGLGMTSSQDTRAKSLRASSRARMRTLLGIVRLAEAANAWMITIDHRFRGPRLEDTSRDIAVEPKTVAQLRELVRATKIPVIVKGIMTPEDALLAQEAGAAGICVSNHGGRVLDHTPGTADVLPAIADKVKGKMVDFGRWLRPLRRRRAQVCGLGRGCRNGGPPHYPCRITEMDGRASALFMKTMRDELKPPWSSPRARMLPHQPSHSGLGGILGRHSMARFPMGLRLALVCLLLCLFCLNAVGET